MRAQARHRGKCACLGRLMYLKTRQAKHLKLASDADNARIKFSRRDAWIARVAQFGLFDRVAPNGPSVRYPQRQLLGLTDTDREWIRDYLVQSLLPDTWRVHTTCIRMHACATSGMKASGTPTSPNMASILPMPSARWKARTT